MVRTQVGTTISAKCHESVAYTLLPCVTIQWETKDWWRRKKRTELWESQRPCTMRLGLEAWGRTMISEIECLSIYQGRQYRKYLWEILELLVGIKVEPWFLHQERITEHWADRSKGSLTSSLWGMGIRRMEDREPWTAWVFYLHIEIAEKLSYRKIKF